MHKLIRKIRSKMLRQKLAICLFLFLVIWILVAFYNSPFDFDMRSGEPCMSNVDRITENIEIKNKDRFNDLTALLSTNRRTGSPKPFERIVIREKVDHYNPTLAQMLNVTIRENMTNLEKFQLRISRQYIYEENDPIVPLVLKDMATLPVVDCDEKDGGTEIKLNIEYPNDIFALFKPMRFPREQQTLPDHFHFSDYERHNAEIAAFHLDRILDFRHTLPVVGRVLNITSDIKPYADGEFGDTFFVSPAGNLCFFGNCKVYCDVYHPVCGNPDLIEGSFATYIPEFNGSARKHNPHPWKRSYSPYDTVAFWEGNDNYCKEIRSKPLYQGRRILDLMDIAVFDFLLGNQDRHHYNTFKIFGNETAPLLYDHGRAFGQPFFDDLLILAPIRQCCLIREKTLKTLLKFHNGPVPLSMMMRQSMASDPLAPILWEPHLEALDRRIAIILNLIRVCVINENSKINLL